MKKKRRKMMMILRIGGETAAQQAGTDVRNKHPFMCSSKTSTHGTAIEHEGLNHNDS